jgi:hypothetical protein
MSLWKDHLDENRMIIQKLGDDCDQAQREGMFAMGQYLREKYGMPNIHVPRKLSVEESLALLESENKGDYKRTGSPNSRCSRADMLTRDQSTGIIASMLSAEDRERMKSFFWNMAKRGFFTNNKTSHRNADIPEKHGTSKRDFLGFDQICNCIRFLWKSPLLFPITLLGDLSLLYSTIKYRYFEKESTDVLNFLLRLSIAKGYFGTYMGRICAKIASSDDLFNRMRAYFTNESYNDHLKATDIGPPMYLIWRKKMIKEVLDK